jgi:polar amino acid transport system substrate-binding protein
MAVCEKLGWTLKLQPIEKENVYVELSSGNIDVAWGGIALDPKEAASGQYTVYGPYIHNDIVVATRNGSAVWNKLRLSGRKMCMPSTPEARQALEADSKLVKRLGQITRLAGGTMECFEYLYAGKCDVVLTDSTAVDYFNCH